MIGKRIVGLSVEALDPSEDEWLKALLEPFSTPCDTHNITRIPHDVTFHSVYFIQVPPYPINGTEITLSVVANVRQIISKCLPEVLRAITEVRGNVLRQLNLVAGRALRNAEITGIKICGGYDR
ncbi:hypothetical protein MPER_01817 [Moniliophthora perniciosa FA553]|nr:hypothetical protein MPER_01817 [Moniliophthora perniciosa FA553]